MQIERITNLNEQEIAAISSSFPVHQLMFENVQKFFADTNNILILAKEGDVFAGITIGYFLQRLDKERAQIFLDSIDVHPDFQRQGIGTAMIEKLKEIGKERGALEMWVLTNKSNKAAMALYSKTGGVSKHDDVVMFDYILEDN